MMNNEPSEGDAILLHELGLNPDPLELDELCHSFDHLQQLARARIGADLSHVNQCEHCSAILATIWEVEDIHPSPALLHHSAVLEGDFSGLAIHLGECAQCRAQARSAADTMRAEPETVLAASSAITETREWEDARCFWRAVRSGMQLAIEVESAALVAAVSVDLEGSLNDLSSPATYVIPLMDRQYGGLRGLSENRIVMDSVRELTAEDLNALSDDTIERSKRYAFETTLEVWQAIEASSEG